MRSLRGHEDRAGLIEFAAYFKTRYDRLQQMLAGRPGSHLVSVDEIHAAVDGQDRRSRAPLTLQWNGTVSHPCPATPGETLVLCTAVIGGPAVLSLSPEQRVQLGRRLLADPQPAPGPRTAAGEER